MTLMDLKLKLEYLKVHNSVISIKAGTEVEAMTFDEIGLMKQISGGILPLTVKIGGPEARNDIDFMLSIQVANILSPMIESAYSLENFVDAVKDNPKYTGQKISINIETISGYNNIIGIFGCPSFKSVYQVTVGRSDLAYSMDTNVEDSQIMEITKDIVRMAKLHNKKTSVGGKIHVNNTQYIQQFIKSDFINTRHITFSTSSRNISRDVKNALEWERDFYAYLLMNPSFSRNDFYKERIASIEKRIYVPAVSSSL